MNQYFHPRLFILVLLLTLPLSVFGQSSKQSLIEYGIEVGGGYNQLFMEPNAYGMHNRTAFSLLPSARVFLGLNVADFGLYTFAGYNQFGGKDSQFGGKDLGDYPAGGVRFSSQVKIEALEFGGFGLYRIADFRFGVGAKYNHHLSISDRYDYFISATADWDWRNYDTFFVDSSIDAGFRGEYLFKNRFSLGFESWFGLTDLQNETRSTENMRFRQNHFRLLIGYRLP